MLIRPTSLLPSRSQAIVLAGLLLCSAGAQGQQLTSARIDPLVVRAGVDTFEMTVTVSDAAVIEVTIDTGSALMVGGVPVTSITLVDDGTSGDDIADDGIFTAGGIEFQNASLLLGGALLRFRDVDFLFSDLATTSTVQDLALTLRYIDPSIPIPTVTDVAPDARTTSYVVALERSLSGSFPSFYVSVVDATQRYYELFPDDRDWLMLAYPFNTVSPAGTFFAVRNDVSGIGRPIFDNSATYGSAGVLRGIIQLYYSHAASHHIKNHEILHQFGVYLDSSLDLGDGPHWGVVVRPSSALGFGTFTDIDFISGSTYWAFRFGAVPLTYNDLELYIMGLVDISEVTSPIQTLENPVWQFNSPTTYCDERGCARPTVYEADASREVTTAEILVAEGGRVPDSNDSPKSFRSGMIVVYDRPLTDVELAFYEYSMSEYEKSTSSLGMSFAEATGDRASISTVLVPEPSQLLLLGAGMGFLWLIGRKRMRAQPARC